MYANRVLARARQGDTSGALADCVAVLRLEPDEPDTFMVRGAVCKILRDEAEAREAYDRAEILARRAGDSDGVEEARMALRRLPAAPVPAAGDCQPADKGVGVAPAEGTIIGITPAFWLRTVLAGIALMSAGPGLFLLCMATVPDVNILSGDRGPLASVVALELVMVNVGALFIYGQIRELKVIASPRGIMMLGASNLVHTAWRHVIVAKGMSAEAMTRFRPRTERLTGPYLGLLTDDEITRPYSAILAVAIIGVGCGFIFASPSIASGVAAALVTAAMYVVFRRVVNLFNPAKASILTSFHSYVPCADYIPLKPFVEDVDFWQDDALGQAIGYYAPWLIDRDGDDGSGTASGAGAGIGTASGDGAAQSRDSAGPTPLSLASDPFALRVLDRAARPFVPLWTVGGVVLVEVVAAALLLRL